MAKDDIYKMTPIYGYDGAVGANVFYVKQADDFETEDDVLDAATAFVNKVLPTITVFQSNDTEYDCLVAQRVDPVSSANRIFALNEVGEISSPALPLNNALKISHYSEDGTRRNRGRWFFGGIPENQQADGRVVEVYTNNLDAFLELTVSTYQDTGPTYFFQHWSPANGDFKNLDKSQLNPVLTKQRGRTPTLCPIF